MGPSYRNSFRLPADLPFPFQISREVPFPATRREGNEQGGSSLDSFVFYSIRFFWWAIMSVKILICRSFNAPTKLSTRPTLLAWTNDNIRVVDGTARNRTTTGTSRIVAAAGPCRPAPTPSLVKRRWDLGRLSSLPSQRRPALGRARAPSHQIRLRRLRPNSRSTAGASTTSPLNTTRYAISRLNSL